MLQCVRLGLYFCFNVDLCVCNTERRITGKCGTYMWKLVSCQRELCFVHICGALHQPVLRWNVVMRHGDILLWVLSRVSEKTVWNRFYYNTSILLFKEMSSWIWNSMTIIFHNQRYWVFTIIVAVLGSNLSVQSL